MWKHPDYDKLTGAPHAATVERQGPPVESGRRLATFIRGEGVEFRVNLAEYEGKPYISLRVWERNDRGEWWPTKKGCSVRMGEAAELGRILLDLAGEGRAGRDAESSAVPERGSEPSGEPAERLSNRKPRWRAQALAEKRAEAKAEKQAARAEAGQGYDRPMYVPPKGQRGRVDRPPWQEQAPPPGSKVPPIDGDGPEFSEF